MVGVLKALSARCDGVRCDMAMLPLNDEGWRILTWRWTGFFVVLALLNEAVWRNFSTDVWVSFKLFAVMPLTFAFALAQVGLLKRYAHA